MRIQTVRTFTNVVAKKYDGARQHDTRESPQKISADISCRCQPENGKHGPGNQ